VTDGASATVAVTLGGFVDEGAAVGAAAAGVCVADGVLGTGVTTMVCGTMTVCTTGACVAGGAEQAASRTSAVVRKIMRNRIDTGPPFRATKKRALRVSALELPEIIPALLAHRTVAGENCKMAVSRIQGGKQGQG
jgi:hypothetical protein